MAPRAEPPQNTEASETPAGLRWNFVHFLIRSTFGGSVVTHLTWAVIAGITGVTFITRTEYADSPIKKLAIWISASLSVIGVISLLGASFIPLANVLGKDLPKAMKEKGKDAKSSSDLLKPSPAAATSRRREKK